jgi:hypothetical protein
MFTIRCRHLERSQVEFPPSGREQSAELVPGPWCVGGCVGDVWHLLGMQWVRVATVCQLHVVCCRTLSGFKVKKTISLLFLRRLETDHRPQGYILS